MFERRKKEVKKKTIQNSIYHNNYIFIIINKLNFLNLILF